MDMMDVFLSKITSTWSAYSFPCYIHDLFRIDEDEHYDEICGYLATISKEDTVKLGVALGLKVTRLEGDDGI